jgi:hypothetical protein
MSRNLRSILIKVAGILFMSSFVAGCALGAVRLLGLRILDPVIATLGFCFLLSLSWLAIDHFLLPARQTREDVRAEHLGVFVASEGVLYFGEYPYTDPGSDVLAVRVPIGEYAVTATIVDSFEDDEWMGNDLRRLVLRCERSQGQLERVPEFYLSSDSGTMVISDRSPDYYRGVFADFRRVESEALDQSKQPVAWAVSDAKDGQCLEISAGEGDYPVAFQQMEDGSVQIVVDFEPDE